MVTHRRVRCKRLFGRLASDPTAYQRGVGCRLYGALPGKKNRFIIARLATGNEPFEFTVRLGNAHRMLDSFQSRSHGLKTFELFHPFAALAPFTRHGIER
jgi:hypothetical protein